MIKGRQNKIHHKSIKTKQTKDAQIIFSPHFLFVSLCQFLQHNNLQQAISVPDGKNISWGGGGGERRNVLGILFFFPESLKNFLEPRPYKTVLTEFIFCFQRHSTLTSWHNRKAQHLSGKHQINQRTEADGNDTTLSKGKKPKQPKKPQQTHTQKDTAFVQFTRAKNALKKNIVGLTILG